MLGLQGRWSYPRPQHRRWRRLRRLLVLQGRSCLWTRHHRCLRLRRLLGLQGRWSQLRPQHRRWRRLRRLLVLTGKPLGEVRREGPAQLVEGLLHLMPAMHQIPLFNEELHAFCHRQIEVLRLARDEQDDGKDHDRSRAGPVDAPDAMKQDLTLIPHQGAR